MKSRVPAVSHDRRADVLDRLVGAAALMLDQTEQMKGLRMTGVDRQDLAAHPLRIRRASRRADARAPRRTIGRSAPLGCLPRDPAAPAGLRRAAAFGSSGLDSATRRYISIVAGNRRSGGDPQGAHGARKKEGMPMARDSAPRPRRWLPWASVLLLTAAGCAEPPATAQVARRGAAGSGGPGPDLVLP